MSARIKICLSQFGGSDVPVSRCVMRSTQEKALPLLESLSAWAIDLELQTLPSGKLGKTLSYLLKQWPKLVRYAEDGRVAIDTNLAENAIRPFCPRAAQLAVRRYAQRR